MLKSRERKTLLERVMKANCGHQHHKMTNMFHILTSKSFISPQEVQLCQLLTRWRSTTLKQVNFPNQTVNHLKAMCLMQLQDQTLFYLPLHFYLLLPINISVLRSCDVMHSLSNINYQDIFFLHQPWTLIVTGKVPSKRKRFSFPYKWQTFCYEWQTLGNTKDNLWNIYKSASNWKN